ncbi:hypothetical protein GCM10009555_075550 [Acrocarpospora macrocephala]|uniref:Uncharacterized protein n=1 Tax=Acrocarpospora macrocephala TaxID=150177 RepID=A0A5M3X1G3_9ACTN|nr:hypothetical protein [Acrocarpospora macrocephala]GES14516.1 hypothetical protein Amac_081130 [Acrocarpospora macrocephala]
MIPDLPFRPTPLTDEEEARFRSVMTGEVIRHLTTSGTFSISADTPESRARFQDIARLVSDALHRPVTSYSNGRRITITFPPDATA